MRKKLLVFRLYGSGTVREFPPASAMLKALRAGHPVPLTHHSMHHPVESDSMGEHNLVHSLLFK